MTVQDAPVDGFWSVTVYNAKGFMEKNERDTYSFSRVTANRNKDGSTTIHFGGSPGSLNYLPITKGWDYVERLCQPRQELLNVAWVFPKAEPASWVSGRVHRRTP